jgi:hypothetical protein
MQSGKIVNSKAFNNCLACHNTTREYDAASDPSHSDFDAEGVGCASCHGPSQTWRSDHYRLPRDNASSAARGLVPNKDLFVRARVCASCHVGDSDRDMNHDIIAAGHPALHYEFATFHNNLPKHWREPEKNRSPDFEAKLWLAGQVAALDASLALLESRATKNLSVSAWPEFATADCSSCHQNLRLGAVDFAAVKPSSTSSYSSWNRFGVNQLLSLNHSDGSELPTAQRLAASLDQLSNLMSARAIPETEAVQIAARNARLDLDAWLQHSVRADMLQFTAGNLNRVAANALADSDRLKRWEFTAQAYLAAIASRNTWLASPSTTSFKDASELRNAILFKPGTNSLAPLDEPNRKIESAAARLLQAIQQTRPIPLPQHKEGNSP